MNASAAPRLTGVKRRDRDGGTWAGRLGVPSASADQHSAFRWSCHLATFCQRHWKPSLGMSAVHRPRPPCWTVCNPMDSLHCKLLLARATADARSCCHCNSLLCFSFNPAVGNCSLQMMRDVLFLASSSSSSKPNAKMSWISSTQINFYSWQPQAEALSSCACFHPPCTPSCWSDPHIVSTSSLPLAARPI
jgi:hypothetical protein